MIVRYQQLAERIQLEIEELNQLVAIIQRHWLSSKNSADHDAFLNSVAFSLQSFYTGLERIFELVANEFDQAALSDKEWHKALLALMSQPVQDVRPKLLQTATAVQLRRILTLSSCCQKYLRHPPEPHQTISPDRKTTRFMVAITNRTLGLHCLSPRTC